MKPGFRQGQGQGQRYARQNAQFTASPRYYLLYLGKLGFICITILQRQIIDKVLLLRIRKLIIIHYIDILNATKNLFLIESDHIQFLK